MHEAPPENPPRTPREPPENPPRPPFSLRVSKPPPGTHFPSAASQIYVDRSALLMAKSPAFDTNFVILDNLLALVETVVSCGRNIISCKIGPCFHTRFFVDASGMIISWLFVHETPPTHQLHTNYTPTTHQLHTPRTPHEAPFFQKCMPFWE